MHKWRVCVYTALLSAADQKCGSLWDAGISGNPTHIALVTSHENVAFHTPIDTYRVGKRMGIKVIISHTSTRKGPITASFYMWWLMQHALTD